MKLFFIVMVIMISSNIHAERKCFFGSPRHKVFTIFIPFVTVLVYWIVAVFAKKWGVPFDSM